MSKSLALFKKLFEPFADALKSDKSQGGRTFTFVEWVHYVIRAHKEFPAGYSKEIRYVQEIGGVNELEDKKGNVSIQDDRQLVVCVRVTDGDTGLYQEALGTAYAGKGDSWGGAMAEAESQAFRRAMANWGLGLEMYLDDETFDIYTQGGADDDDGDDEQDDGGSDDDGDDDEDEDDGSDEPDEDEDGDDDEDGDEDDVRGEDDEDGGDDDEDDEDEPAPTDRQIRVLTDIGQALKEYIGDAKKSEARRVNAIIADQRGKLEARPTRRTAGIIIRRFRRLLSEIGVEDPTSEDE